MINGIKNCFIKRIFINCNFLLNKSMIILTDNQKLTYYELL